MSGTKNIFKRMMHLSLLASVGFAALLYGASPALAQISLGTAESFGVLGASTVTNTGASVITGNLGVSPGTAVTGFPPGIVTGTIHSADAVAAQAQIDLTTAYNAITATPILVDLTGQDLGGLTLTPGVYGFNSSAQLTGTLTLDAQGNPNAVFIFKIGSTLTTASGSSVAFINVPVGIDLNCNVFWQVGSSATLGTTTAFAGNILAMASITLTTGANVNGRALARTGAVTLDGNHVTVCPPIVAPPLCPIITLIPPPSPPNLPPGVVGTPYNQTFTASGGTAPYAYAVSSGTLPTGLPPFTLNPLTGAMTGTPTTVGTFIFTITATDANGCFIIQPYIIVIAAAACPPITLSPLALPSGPLGAAYSQTVFASGGTPPYTFAVTAGFLPPGLPPFTLISSGPSSALLSGTPNTAGIFSFTITATDSLGCLGSLAYSILITPCPVITVSPPTLPTGGVGTFYSQTISASGGTGPYTILLSSGALPPGLTLTPSPPSSAVLSGTPTTAGVFAFIITATDANGCTALLGYTVTIALAPVSTPTLSEWGMIIFMVLVGLMSIYYLRRQKAKA